MVCSAIVTVISNSALDFRLFIISQVDAIARAININCPVIYVSEFLLKINREKRLNYFFFFFNFLCKKKQKQQQKEILLLFFKIWAPHGIFKRKNCYFYTLPFNGMVIIITQLMISAHDDTFYQCEFVISFFCECFLLFRPYRSTGKSVTASYLPRRIQLWWKFLFFFFR